MHSLFQSRPRRWRGWVLAGLVGVPGVCGSEIVAGSIFAGGIYSPAPCFPRIAWSLSFSCGFMGGGMGLEIQGGALAYLTGSPSVLCGLRPDVAIVPGIPHLSSHRQCAKHGTFIYFPPSRHTWYWVSDDGGLFKYVCADPTTDPPLRVGEDGAGGTYLGCTIPPGTDPELTLDPAPLPYAEPDPATPVGPAATVTDPEDNFDGGTLAVQITANPEAADRLSVLNAGGVAVTGTDVQVGGVSVATADPAAVTGADTLTVTFNAAAAAADVEAVAQAVGYDNTSDDPGTAQRTVTVTVTDDTARADSQTREIQVTAVNDPPTDISLSNSSVDENRGVDREVGRLSTSDPDG